MTAYRMFAMGFAALALLLNSPMQAPAESAGKKGHDHSSHADTHGHGTLEDLGTTTVAGVKMSVGQMGEVKEGSEGVFEICLEKGQEKPRAVRVWVGTASAQGSVKSKAEPDGDQYHAHVEVPKSLPKDAQLWIEVEPEKGKKQKAGFPLKR